MGQILPRQPIAGIVAPDAGDTDEVGSQRCNASQALGNGVRGQTRALSRSWAGVGDFAFGKPARFIADIDFERLGSGVAHDT